MRELLLVPPPVSIKYTNDLVHKPVDQILVDGAHQYIITSTLGANAFRFEVKPDAAPYIACDYDHTLSKNEDAYRLIIRKPKHPGQTVVQLTSVTRRGQRYGLITLKQILRQCGRHIPTLEIFDEPAFKYRGVMLDISRDRVPSMEQLKLIAQKLAELKINHLQLYTEHTFAYKGHEEVWRKASPLTAAEMTEFAQYCADFDIDLAGNQACLGHMTRWLKHEAYAPLAETHGEWPFLHETRTGPWSLNPTDPNSEALIRDLIDQQARCLKSHYFNVNLDESYDIGCGGSADAVKARGKAAVFGDYLHAMYDITQSAGKRMMMWSDIVISYPALIADLPKDMIVLDWGYEKDAPFAEHARMLTEAGMETWVCPGTSCWQSFAGRTSVRDANLKQAADECNRHKVTGMLITNWGDKGHWQVWPVELLGIAEGATMAWNAQAEPGNCHEAISFHLFGDRHMKTGDWIRALGEVDFNLREVSGPAGADGSPAALRNASPLHQELQRPHATAPKGDEALWLEADEKLKALEPKDQLDKLPALLKEELQLAYRFSQLAIQRALSSHQSDHNDEPAPAVMSEAQSIITTHRRLWPRRSRPGGLNDSLDYFASLNVEPLDGKH